MRTKFLTFWTLLLIPFLASGQAVTTNPKVEDASVSDVKITRVEITDKHTAIYLRYRGERGNTPIPPNVPPAFRDYFRMQQSSPEIWLDPNTRLYKPGDVNTKFKLLRAEGIPTNPERKKVEDGEVVEFVAYFEKVTPGIEIIDFYEGKSAGTTRAWNFYGIHIKNPDPKKQPKQAEPVAQEPAKQEEPAAVASAVASVSLITGKVVDAGTGNPLKATIQYVEDGDTVTVSSNSGRYRIGITPGKSYTLTAMADGFTAETWTYESGQDSSGVVEHDFTLSALKEGTTFTLENIYFETSSYNLLPESFDELDKFVKIMKENPKISISVEGHTDNVGNFDKNVELSRQRAESVKGYLVEKGIDAVRIETRGFGPTKPVAKGTSEEEKQKNRRVEIVILKS